MTLTKTIVVQPTVMYYMGSVALKLWSNYNSIIDST